MKIVFRVDASVQMGSGHLMRCLTLAQALSERGVHVRFICGDQIGNLNDWLINQGIAVTEIIKADIDVAKDAELTISALSGDRPDWLVVDHYGLDVCWEQTVRPFVERVLVIDDQSGRRHDCDLLLDQNFASEGEHRYAGRVPHDCRMLLGPSFALLRKVFGELRHKVNRRKSLENVLVFFTGGDDQGETLKAMQGVEKFGSVKNVDVVVGRSNLHNNAIKKKCDELDWGFHCQVDYMPALIAKADLVIGAGGSSNWERCALGVPAMVAILSDNQAKIAQDLDSAGVVINLGWAYQLTPDDYAEALKTIDLRRLSDMSDKALKVTDAAGASRVADALLHL